MIFETETNRSIEEETVENIILQSTIEEDNYYWARLFNRAQYFFI